MRRIVVSEFITVDGVIEDPGGQGECFVLTYEVARAGARQGDPVA